MRGISLRTIFIILFIALIVFAIYKTQNKSNSNENLEEETQKSQTMLSSELRVAIVEFDNINPILSNNKNVQDISRLIYEPLITYTNDYKLEPCLATEWTKSGDKTYLVKLREGVKWSNGSDFTSSDVQFTVDILKDKNIQSIYSYNVKNIENINIIDEYTLKFELFEEDLFFEYNLTFPIMSEKYYENASFTSEVKNKKPVSTGMFYISETDSYDIVLKKNMNWWNINNKNSKIGKITVNLYDSMNGLFTDFKNSKLDLFTTSNLNYEKYLEDEKYNQVQYINRNYFYLALNCDSDFLSSAAVRKAIAMTIDKKSIIDKLYGGKYKQSDNLLGFGSFITNNQKIETNLDRDKAQDELVNDGWSYENDYWRRKDSFRYLKLELKILVNKNNREHVKIANEIKDNLRKIGISSKIVEAEGKKYDSYIRNNDYDIVVIEKIYGYSPNLSNYFGEGNFANYNNEDIYSKISEYRYVSSNEEIANKDLEILAICNEETPYISLFYNTNTLISKNELQGKIEPNSYNIFYNIETWYREYEVNS